MKILDCTLRDGGYYNNWDFPIDIINDYLKAISLANVNVVEMGLRSQINNGFKGACAYTTDGFLNKLKIPSDLEIAVMLNASELKAKGSFKEVLESLFPNAADETPVDIVRLACHAKEFEEALPASNWLKDRGFQVGFNLMQISDRNKGEIEVCAKEISKYPVDVFYIADSLGSLKPKQTAEILSWVKKYWKGALGVHTHDNLGLALQNTLTALDEGATWLDATVTGMGRGPGNSRTEELVIEVSERLQQDVNLVPLMNIINKYFEPMKEKFKWGSNPYYYLSGKYGIHPTYVQEMLSDARYSEADIIAAINHIRVQGGKSFSYNKLDLAQQFYNKAIKGDWSPKENFKDREVLIIGAGKGAIDHQNEIEEYIKKNNPIVLALNCQSMINEELIDYRVACHPIRLLADYEAYATLPQSLIVPASALPGEITTHLNNEKLLDFGLEVGGHGFEFNETGCVTPNSLVISYALSIATSGKCSKILLAGFDGFRADDPRSKQMNKVFDDYKKVSAIPVISITKTRYDIASLSIYGM